VPGEEELMSVGRGVGRTTVQHVARRLPDGSAKVEADVPAGSLEGELRPEESRRDGERRIGEPAGRARKLASPDRELVSLGYGSLALLLRCGQ
jgi:hypothetical protein